MRRHHGFPERRFTRGGRRADDHAIEGGEDGTLMTADDR